MSRMHPESNGTPVERDMSLHQRGLVDTCFEEGQYEAGIVVLDQLNTLNCRPSRSHIRQLVYLGLYPPPPEDHTQDSTHLRPVPGSPSKALGKQSLSSLAPSPEATEAALNLLTAFALTNSPEALLAALPSYGQVAQDGLCQSTLKGVDDENEDSFIATQSVRIKNAKDCWAILREGFIQRKADNPTTQRKRKESRRRELDEDESQRLDVDPQDETPSPVGSHAWAVFDWMLTIFERDEDLTEEKSQIRYSPLLLSQIPPPRTGSVARWDLDMPLDAAFYALQQDDAERRTMGRRLLTLLINLSSTIFIDLPLFLTLFSNRAFTLSPDSLSSLLAMLPSSTAILQFKIMMFRKYLVDFSESSTVVDPKSRPQARTQPRPVAARRRQLQAPGDEELAKTVTSAGTPEVVARNYPHMPPEEISELLKNSSPPSDSASRIIYRRIQVDLAIAYCLLHKRAVVVDKEWQSLMISEVLKSPVEKVEEFSLDASLRSVLLTLTH